MANNYPKTLDDIVEAVRQRAKIATDDTDHINSIKAFVQQRYFNVSTETKWRWLHNVKDFKIVAKYTTGTVSVTNDSAVVTGVGTTFIGSMVGSKITISGEDTIFTIITFSSSTRITLSERVQRSTTTGLSYTIYKNEFLLWPELDQIENIWHEFYNFNSYGKVYPISNDEMVSLTTERNASSGKAQYYTIDKNDNYAGAVLGTFFLGSDLLGNAATNKVLLIYPPIPDEAYIIHVRYTYSVAPLTSGISEPLLPLNDRWVLVYGALSDYYDQAGDKTSASYWNNEFEKGMRRMIRDNDDTDDKAKLIVVDRWRNNNRTLSPRNSDLGSYFDRYYTRRG